MAKTTKNKLSGMISEAPMPYKATAEDKARQRKYEVEDALRTVTRAEEIKRDRPLMAAVKKCATEQIKCLQTAVKKK